MKIAFAGKGGAGKSLVAGTAARLLARRGERVLALDSDSVPGLSLSLGRGLDPSEQRLAEAAERRDNGWWYLKRGIGAVRAVQRYSIEAPDGVRLLQGGKTTMDGLGPPPGAVWALHEVVHRLGSPAFKDWSIVGDLSGGPRQVAYDWAPYAGALVVLVEPTVKSALTAKRIAKIASGRRSARIVFVASKSDGPKATALVEQLIDAPVVASIPVDQGAAEAERTGLGLIDHAPDSPAVVAVGRLLQRLAELEVTEE